MRRAAVAIAATLAACSIDRATDDLACFDDFQCEDGRECRGGFCVIVPVYDAPIDATPPPDADPCPSECDSCDPGYTTCTIDCDTPGSCGGQVDCPPGMACIVNCSGINSCNNGVDCGNATTCTVTCSGTNSCDDPVECGPNRCDVACSGGNSCDQGVDCGPACACGVTCAVTACNDPTLSCPTVCDVGLRDCSTTADPICNTCPMPPMPDAAVADAAVPDAT